jgi:hypothetical protein
VRVERSAGAGGVALETQMRSQFKTTIAANVVRGAKQYYAHGDLDDCLIYLRKA